jgi:Tol biopolymer transport system component
MPRFSPDGSKLAYRSYGFPFMFINVLDVKGGSSRRLDTPQVQPIPERGYTWSPDGRGILMLAFKDGSGDIYVFPADGGTPLATGVRRLGLFRRSYGIPRLSAWLGERVLMSVGDGSRFNLAEISISRTSSKASGALRPITQGSGSEYGASPAADGKRLAFAAYTESNSSVWRLPMDVASGKPTGVPVELTSPLRFSQMPAPAAGAAVLGYVSYEGSSPAVWLRDLASGRDRRIAEQAAWPVLTADGRKVAFRHVEPGRSDTSPGPLFLAGTESESVRKVSDRFGVPYHFFAGDSKLLFDHIGPGSREIRALDLASGQTTIVARHAKNPIYAPHLSPDEKWMSFLMVVSDRQRHFYVAPFRGEKEIPDSEWMLVFSGDNLDRQPFWSPVGDLLYFLSDRDGFRCVWALRLGAQTRKPAGEAFAVHHLHDIRYTMNPFPNPAHVGLSVNQDSMFLSLIEERANVWLAEEAPQR